MPEISFLLLVFFSLDVVCNDKIENYAKTLLQKDLMISIIIVEGSFNKKKKYINLWKQKLKVRDLKGCYVLFKLDLKLVYDLSRENKVFYPKVLVISEIYLYCFPLGNYILVFSSIMELCPPFVTLSRE